MLNKLGLKSKLSVSTFFLLSAWALIFLFNHKKAYKKSGIIGSSESAQKQSVHKNNTLEAFRQHGDETAYNQFKNVKKDYNFETYKKAENSLSKSNSKKAEKSSGILDMISSSVGSQSNTENKNNKSSNVPYLSSPPPGWEDSFGDNYSDASFEYAKDNWADSASSSYLPWGSDNYLQEGDPYLAQSDEQAIINGAGEFADPNSTTAEWYREKLEDYYAKKEKKNNFNEKNFEDQEDEKNQASETNEKKQDKNLPSTSLFNSVPSSSNSSSNQNSSSNSLVNKNNNSHSLLAINSTGNIDTNNSNINGQNSSHGNLVRENKFKLLPSNLYTWIEKIQLELSVIVEVRPAAKLEELNSNPKLLSAFPGFLLLWNKNKDENEIIKKIVFTSFSYQEENVLFLNFENADSWNNALNNTIKDEDILNLREQLKNELISLINIEKISFEGNRFARQCLGLQTVIDLIREEKINTTSVKEIVFGDLMNISADNEKLIIKIDVSKSESDIQNFLNVY